MSLNKWVWKVAQIILDSEGPKTLERFITDLRACSLPHDFSNTIINWFITLRKSGVNMPTILNELKTFPSITAFKETKAVVLATLYNAYVSAQSGGGDAE